MESPTITWPAHVNALGHVIVGDSHYRGTHTITWPAHVIVLGHVIVSRLVRVSDAL